MAKTVKVQPVRQKSVGGRWLKNAMQAVGSSTKAVLKEYSPNVSDAMSSGAQLARQFNQTLRGNTSNMNKASRQINQNRYVRFANTAFRNAIHDIATGKLAGDESRADAAMSKSMGFDSLFGDSGLTFGDEGADGTNVNINYVDTGGDANGLAELSSSVNRNAELTLKTSKAQMDAYVAISTATMQQTQAISAQINEHLSNINNNLAALVEYNNTNMNKFIEASMAYMERVGGAMDKEGSSGGKRDDNVNSLFNANGGIDLGRYKQYVKGRVKENLQGTQFGMVTSLLSDDILEQMAANPLGMVSTELIKVVMPEVLTTTIKGVEQTFTSMVPGMLQDLYRWGERQRGTTVKKFTGSLAKAFGIGGDTRVNDVDKAEIKVNRGVIPFDGETKHTITTVITKELREQTSYLRYIAEHYGLNGKKRDAYMQDTGRFFDYGKNRFVSIKEMNENMLADIQKSINQGFAGTQFGKAMARGINAAGGNQAELESLLSQFYGYMERSDKKYDYSKGKLPKDLKNVIKGFEGTRSGKNELSAIIEQIIRDNPSVMLTLSQGQMRARMEREARVKQLQEEYASSGILHSDMFDQKSKKTGERITIDELMEGYYRRQAQSARKEGRGSGSYNDVDMRAEMQRGDINQEAMDLLGRMRGSSIRGVKEFGSAIMAGNTRDAMEAVGTAFADMGRHVFDSMKDTVFLPMKEFIFGKKNNQGYSQGGLMSGTTNAFKDMVMETAHQLTGREYIDSSGERHPHTNDSVMGQVTGALKEKFFGKEKTNEDGTTAKEGGMFNFITDSVKEGLASWHNAIFGKQDRKSQEVTKDNVLKLIKDTVKERSPEMAKGAILGGAAGLASGGLLGAIVGGPIGGLISGAALGFAGSTEKFKHWLFGDEEKDNGFISKKVQDYFKKNKNPLIAGAAVGGFKGALTGGGLLGTLVGGPMAGALVGMTTTMALKSEAFHNFLFGDEKNGKLGVIQSFKKAFRNASGKKNNEDAAGLSLSGKALGMGMVGAAGGAFTMATVSKMGILGSALTPVGPIGGALVGLGLSIAANGNLFRKWLFGDEKDKKDPEHKAGILGQFTNSLQVHLLNPLRRTVTDLAEDASWTFKHKILDTVEFAVEPITTAAADFAGRMKDRASNFLNGVGKTLGEKVVNPIVDVAQKAVITPFQKMTSGVARLMYGVGKKLLEAPFRFVDATVQFMTSPVRKVFQAAFHPVKTAKRLIGFIENTIEKHTGFTFEPINNAVKEMMDATKKKVKNFLTFPFRLVKGVVGGAAKGVGKAMDVVGDVAGGMADNMHRKEMAKYKDGDYDEKLKKKYDKEASKGRITDEDGNEMDFETWKESYINDPTHWEKRWRERRKSARKQEASELAKLKHDRYERKMREKNEKYILKATGMSHFEDTEENRRYVEAKLGKEGKINWNIAAVDSGKISDSATLSDDELASADPSKMSNEVRQTSILQRILNVLTGRNFDGSITKNQVPEEDDKSKEGEAEHTEYDDEEDPMNSGFFRNMKKWLGFDNKGKFKAGAGTENLGFVKELLRNAGVGDDEMSGLDAKGLYDLFEAKKMGFGDITKHITSEMLRESVGDTDIWTMLQGYGGDIDKLINGLFTGKGYAKGSDNTDAGISLVGEERPELVMTEKGGKVLTDRDKALRVFITGASQSFARTVRENGGMVDVDELASANAAMLSSQAKTQREKDAEFDKEQNAKLANIAADAKAKATDLAVTADEQLQAKRQKLADANNERAVRALEDIAENTKKTEEGESLFHKLWKSIFSKKGLVTAGLLLLFAKFPQLLELLAKGLGNIVTSLGNTIGDNLVAMGEDAQFHSESNATTNGKGSGKEFQEGWNDAAELLDWDLDAYLRNDEGKMDHRSWSKFNLLAAYAHKFYKKGKPLRNAIGKFFNTWAERRKERRGEKFGERSARKAAKRAERRAARAGRKGAQEAGEAVVEILGPDDVDIIPPTRVGQSMRKPVAGLLDDAGEAVIDATYKEVGDTIVATTARETAENVAEAGMKEVAENVGETAVKKNKKLLAKVLDMLSGFVDNVAAKVLKKGQGQGAIKTIVGLVKKVLAKHFPKIAAKISGIISGNAVLAATTAGVGFLIKEGSFILLESFNQVTGTAALFQVSKDDVDGTMRLIAAGIGAMKGTTPGAVLDVVAELVGAMTGVNLYTRTASVIYELARGEEDYDKLRADQKSFQNDYTKHQQKQIEETYNKLKKIGLAPKKEDGTELTLEEYTAGVQDGSIKTATYDSFEDYNDKKNGTIGSKMLRGGANLIDGAKATISDWTKGPKNFLFGGAEKQYFGNDGRVYIPNSDGTFDVMDAKGKKLGTLDRYEQFEDDVIGESEKHTEGVFEKANRSVTNFVSDTKKAFSDRYSKKDVQAYRLPDGTYYKQESGGWTHYDVKNAPLSDYGAVPTEEVMDFVHSGLAVAETIKESVAQAEWLRVGDKFQIFGRKVKDSFDGAIENYNDWALKASKKVDDGFNKAKEFVGTKLGNIRDYWTKKQSIYRLSDGTYYKQEGGGWTLYDVKGVAISDVGAVLEDDVLSLVRSGLAVAEEGETTAKENWNNFTQPFRDFGNKVKTGFLEDMKTIKETVDKGLNYAKDKVQKAGQAIADFGKKTKEFFIGSKVKRYWFADMTYLEGNGDGTYDHYSSTGNRLTEGGVFDGDMVLSMIDSGTLVETEVYDNSGLEATVDSFVQKARNGADKLFTKGLGTAVDIFSEVAGITDKQQALLKDTVLKGYENVKGFFKAGSQEAWFDGKGNYYVKEGNGYTYYNLNGDKLSTKKKEEVEAMIESGVLTKGTIKKDSAAKEAINKIQQAAEDAWQKAKTVASSAWNNFKNWLSGGSGYGSVPGGSGTGTRRPVTTSKQAIRSIGGGFGPSASNVNNFPFYSQNDSRWANERYEYDNDGGTIGTSGCGPTAMSMAISGATGQPVDPRRMAKLAEATGTRDDTGTNWNFVSTSANMYGLETHQEYNPSTKFIRDSLRAGNPVVLSGTSPGNNTPYTSAGHYVVAVGEDGRGNIRVNDPRGKAYSRAYSPGELKKYTTSAWEIGRGGYGLHSSNRYRGGYGPNDPKATSADMLNNFPFLLQNDSRWGSLPYTVRNDPSQTIGSSGCGPTAVAEVLRSYGIDVTPVDTCKWSIDHGYRMPSGGTATAFIKAISESYGLKSEQIGTNNAALESTLRSGIPVVASMGPPTFTSGGHYITLVGLNSAGEVLVNDPASKARSEKSYPVSTFVRETNHGFHAISKNGQGSINNLGNVTAIGGTNTNGTETTPTEGSTIMDKVSGFFNEVGVRMTNALFTNELDSDFSKYWTPQAMSSALASSVTGNTSTPLTTTAGVLQGNSNTEKIWNYLTTKGGMTKEGAAGLMGNLEAESGMEPGNAENLLLQRLGNKYTDETYTAAVDSGEIDKATFLHPLGGNTQYGYGIAQWTSPNRKAGLYDLVKSRNVSISDLGTQLDWLMQEMNGSYGGVYSLLKSTKSVPDAAKKVLLDFEVPANASSHIPKRTANAQKWFNTYAGTGGTGGRKRLLSKKGGLYKLIHGGFGLSKYFKNVSFDENEKHGGYGGTAADAREAVVQWMLCLIRRNTYTMSPERSRVLEGIDGHGYGDCSSTCCKVYERALGKIIGTYTEDMYPKGQTIQSNSTAGFIPDESRMLPGDLVFFYSRGTSGKTGHVEMYIGNGYFAGHGGGGDKMGPTIKKMADYIPGRESSGSGSVFRVVRYISDAEAPSLNIQKPDPSKLKVQNTFTDGKGMSANGANTGVVYTDGSNMNATTTTAAPTTNQTESIMDKVSGFYSEAAVRGANSLFTGEFDKNFGTYWNPVTQTPTSTGGVVSTGGPTLNGNFPKYADLNTDQKHYLAQVIHRETGGDNLAACRDEASQMVNLNEVFRGNPPTASTLYQTVRYSGWYGKDRAIPPYAQNPSEYAKSAVETVMVGGQRTLPRYVTEHDMFPLDAAISGHWGNGKSEDRSQYIPHQTKISQNPGRFNPPSSYTFYKFFGDDNTGDVAGYYEKDYQKYKADAPRPGDSGGNGYGTEGLREASKYIRSHNLKQGDHSTVKKAKDSVRLAKRNYRGGYGTRTISTTANTSHPLRAHSSIPVTNVSGTSGNNSLLEIVQRSQTTDNQGELLRCVVDVLAIIADNTGLTVSTMQRLNNLMGNSSNKGNTVVVANGGGSKTIPQTVVQNAASQPSRNEKLARQIASGGVK